MSPIHQIGPLTAIIPFYVGIPESVEVCVHTRTPKCVGLPFRVSDHAGQKRLYVSTVGLRNAGILELFQIVD
jgi:hypothetical protein